MILAMTVWNLSAYAAWRFRRMWRLTVQSNNADDEANGQDENDDGIDLEAGRLVGVEPFNVVSLSIIPPCSLRVH